MLAKLTAALVAYGPLGILVLAFVDSFGIPLATGMDALVLLVSAKAPGRAWLAVSMGILGSVGGNIALFMAARKGLRRFIKEPDPSKRQRFRAWFRRYGLLTCFIPSMLPVPLPLKVFVVSAAVFHSPFLEFVGVIALGRAIRYGGEAYLGVKLGEHSVAYLRAHSWALLGGAIALFMILYALLMLNARRRRLAGEA
jgi:membrane protein YqaA with SNARE-associated domain